MSPTHQKRLKRRTERVDEEDQGGDAPTQYHSCKRFSPREQAIYLPNETYQAAQSSGDPEAFTRDQYLHFMHGLLHAKKWHSRVEAGKKNSDHEGMSHEEIVVGIQRYRIEEAGSAEAFIQKRLGEELEAKQWAYDIINKMEIASLNQERGNTYY